LKQIVSGLVLAALTGRTLNIAMHIIQQLISLADCICGDMRSIHYKMIDQGYPGLSLSLIGSYISITLIQFHVNQRTKRRETSCWSSRRRVECCRRTRGGTSLESLNRSFARCNCQRFRIYHNPRSKIDTSWRLVEMALEPESNDDQSNGESPRRARDRDDNFPSSWTSSPLTKLLSSTSIVCCADRVFYVWSDSLEIIDISCDCLL
jgi:hypothetical protein